MIEHAYLSLRESQAQKQQIQKTSRQLQSNESAAMYMCTLQHYRVAIESIINTTVRIIINIKLQLAQALQAC